MGVLTRQISPDKFPGLADPPQLATRRQLYHDGGPAEPTETNGMWLLAFI
jgi:hypothetical protein